MTMPRITVITPVFNQGDFVERTICSVLDQGYADLEYLVVDAGSLDDSSYVLRQYESQLTWWEAMRYESIPAAINEALGRATGEVVTILPAGDVLFPLALHEAGRAYAASREASRWTAGSCQRLNEQDEPLGGMDASISGLSLLQLTSHETDPLPLAGMFFARDVFEAHGRFDETMTQAYACEHQCRLLAAGLSPSRLPATAAGVREMDEPADPRQTLTRGLEMIGIAEHYADTMPMTQRLDVWRSCDRRRRIYAMASAELDVRHARSLLWQEVARRPWWLSDRTLRHMLVKGVEHPVPLDDQPARRAA